ncbi:MAG: hypothetical protein LQ339_003063 [Xanthoria mediterranea]|nr:MAG: hypothetical protein LQ339_003063 [Xanthoria mediterranea]
MRKQAPSISSSRFEKPRTRQSPRPSAPLRNPILLTAISGLLFGFIVYRQIYKKKPSSEDLAPQDFDFSARFNATAGRYDEDVDRVEWFYGITKLRRKLVQQAQGNVLEAAVGTGRNSEFYELRRIASLTLQDQSREMLEIAKAKWREQHPEYEHCKFILGSAFEPLPLPIRGKMDLPEDNGYDTIIATMSLCSIPGPSLFLRSLAGHLSWRKAAVQDDGGDRVAARILLLEHGRSYFSWLNYLLDQTAAAHARQHGCWWNRDIGKIAEDSGLEVISTKRKHFGTTWVLELGLPADGKGVKRQQWLEDTRQQIAMLQTEVAQAHVEWKERMRKEEEARRKEEDLEAWRREQREQILKPKGS